MSDRSEAPEGRGPVQIDFRKWPDTPHWRFTMQPLGEDEHGFWFFAPAGTLARRGDEPAQHTAHDFVKLVRPDAWWSAIWNRGGRFEIYADVSTPAEFSLGRIRLIDLDLDVVRLRDRGRTEVHDEDEFLLHQRTLGYPEHVVATARSTAAWLTLAIEQRREPFGRVGPRWLERM